jgi:hypothetical protein
MKSSFLSLSLCPIAAQGLLTGFAFLLCGSAGAQNLLKNGDFEQPLGPTNWTVMYLHGGPGDFEIKGRSRGGSRHAAWFGGYLRPLALKLAHAYFTQTVTNLSTNHLYTVSGYMREDWWRDRDPDTGLYNPNGDGKRDKFLVYIEVIGGLGTPTPDGRASTNAVNQEPPTGPPAGFPDCLIYANGDWEEYSVQQKPDANGKIEVRLHYYKISFSIYDKLWIMAGAFDDFSLTP